MSVKILSQISTVN